MIRMSDINYYLGCVLICIAIIAVIILVRHIKKLILIQEHMNDQLMGMAYNQQTQSDRLYDISNDIYFIKQRVANK